MKINFLYEFTSCHGSIVNGINPYYLKFLFNDDFSFQRTNVNDFQSNINHKISFWKPAYLYNYGNSVDCNISNVTKFNKNELYLYPICTSGDLFEFLSLRDTIHDTPLFYISSNTKNLLKKHDNFFIYLEHPGEPYFDSDLLNQIYEVCDKNDIPFNKIIIVNGTNSNEFILKDFKENYGVSSCAKLVSYNWPIPFKALELRTAWGMEVNPESDNSTIANINHINFKKSHKALFLVKRLRVHRLLLLSLIFESKIIKDILYSLDVEMNLYPTFIDILKNEPETLPVKVPENYFDKITDGYLAVMNKKKVTLDYDDFNSVHGFGMETKELYESTYFSIVAETEFSEYQQSITEKILKPIMHCHPFVVLGSPYSLKTLKSYGFKTFDKWWDESYDSDIDDWNRLKKVYNLIDYLTSKSNDEWNVMLLEMKDTLEYNQKLLSTFDSKWILSNIKKNITHFYNKNVSKLL